MIVSELSFVFFMAVLVLALQCGVGTYVVMVFDLFAGDHSVAIENTRNWGTDAFVIVLNDFLIFFHALGDILTADHLLLAFLAVSDHNLFVFVVGFTHCTMDFNLK